MSCAPVIRQPQTLFLMGLAALLSLSHTVHADPILAAEPIQQSAPVGSNPFNAQTELADLAHGDILISQSAESTADSAAAPAPAPRSPNPATLPNVAQSAQPSLQSVIKETVRPVYNELSEAGALEVWRDLKEDLGLSKHPGDRDGGRDDAASLVHQMNAETTSPWQTPEQRPRTAAQAQFDRDMDAYLLRQLIEDVKPWAYGLVGLYAVGYVLKATFNLAQWRNARRRERRARHAHHHRTAHSVNRDKDPV